MSALLAAAAALLLVFGAGVLFMRLDARRLAAAVRLAGPVTLAMAGGGLILIGRAGLGGMLLSAALAWFGRNRFAGRVQKAPGRRSAVRTAALEMELDHDTGGLEGIVLAGVHEGRELATMSLAELKSLMGELAADAESRQLLETYLDARFPVWRDDAEPDGGLGEGVAPRPGSMTKQEAYQILGLEAGASPADVRKAHRRLMQRLHPDIGGTSFLAARINEAKDILLSNHN